MQYYQFSSIKEFTNEAKQEHDELFFPKNTNHTVPVTHTPTVPTHAKNDDHGAFLLHHWNSSNKNPCLVNEKTTTTTACTTMDNTHNKIPVKDDPSVTPALKTLCTP